MRLKQQILPRSVLILVFIANLAILRPSTQPRPRYDRAAEEVSSPLHQHTNRTAASGAVSGERRQEYYNDSLRGPSVGCLDLNSQRWLDGPRYGNAGEHIPLDYVSRTLTEPISDALVRLLLTDTTASSNQSKVGGLPVFLSQSLCHERSRFLSLDWNVRDFEGMTDVSIARIEQSWTIRLIYLAMIHHQQQHALTETLMRFRSWTTSEGRPTSCQSHLQQEYGVGSYDFECRDAKFLIASLADVGIGANVRGGRIEALLAGLISDRVVVFVNNSPVGHKFLRQPWALVSCPRRDYQCFFFPTSPCVLSQWDIQTAYRLTKAESSSLRLGKLPEGHEGEKVWHMTLSFTPHQQIPVEAAQRLYNHSLAILRPLLEDSRFRSDPRRLMLARAARQILQRNVSRRTGYNYGAANLPIHHALAVFATRPNLHFKAKLPSGIDDIVTSTRNKAFSGDIVGLPIRASDKCDRESECLSFLDYLQATAKVLELHHGMAWPNSLPGQQSLHSSDVKERATLSGPTLIVTTESLSMVEEVHRYKTNHAAQRTLPYAFHILTNDRDVTPDTGYMPSLVINKANTSFTADEALLSAVSSLQFQLLSKVTVGNCCSNFHVLLADLLAAGCGSAADHTLHCLQEHDDPHYRLCCGWFRNCKEEKRVAMEKMENRKTTGINNSALTSDADSKDLSRSNPGSVLRRP